MLQATLSSNHGSKLWLWSTLKRDTRGITFGSGPLQHEFFFQSQKIQNVETYLRTLLYFINAH